MATYRVDIQPDVLIWARRRVNLTEDQAASRMGVSTLTLRYWEAGADTEVRPPTLVQLRKLARTYGLPLSALYLSHPPTDSSKRPADFRTLSSSNGQAWSLELHGTYLRVVMQREVMRELAIEHDEVPEPIDLALSTKMSHETAAEQIRAWLGISLGTQLQWRDEYQALNSWSVAIEGKGILVTQSQGVEVAEMRGFSIAESPFPVIVLNGSDAVHARIFTLIHELVHVLLRKSGICDVNLVQATNRGKAYIENYCNQVAAAFLLPLGAMNEEIEARHVARQDGWTDRELAQLSRRYRVSREVILRRMVTLNQATLEFFFKKIDQYALQYEIQAAKSKSQEGHPVDWSRRVVRNLGRRFTGEVLDAYDQRIIDAAELTEYLGVKIEAVPGISAILENGR